jgi:hypothetical protein
MKAKHIGLMGMLLATMTVSAQTIKQAKTAYDDDRYNSYDRIHTVNGKKVEEIKMNHHDKIYKAEFVNEKMTALSIDGEKIPESEWPAHADAITAIRIQIKQNEEQAKENAKQAVRNAEQAKANEVQEKRNDEQARLNEIQAKKNAGQDVRNDEQAKRNDEQAKLNEVQAKKNAEQEMRNDEQAKKNQEQAHVNEQQAKLNAEQAAENERFIKQLTEDLVSDKIIPDKDSLREFNLDMSEMTVNGVKQSDVIFKNTRKNTASSHQGDSIIRGMASSRIIKQD